MTVVAQTKQNFLELLLVGRFSEQVEHGHTECKSSDLYQLYFSPF